MQQEKMRCDDCGGEIKSTVDLLAGGKEEFIKALKRNGIALTLLPDGYNCIDCGKCWDKDMKPMKIKLGWLEVGGK